MKTPYLIISRSGETANLLDKWGPRFLKCTITDKTDKESDEVSIELDDKDGSIEDFETGQKITVAGGYQEDGSEVQGEFEINTVSYKGWPQKVVIAGTAASAKKTNKERKTEKHDKDTGVKNVGELMEKLAKRNGWEAKVSDEIKSIPIEYEAQSEESDQALATRVGNKYGAAVNIKSGKLVVRERGSGKTVSGKEMEPVKIWAGEGGNIKSYTVTFKDKPKHGKGEGQTFNRKTGKKETVDVKLEGGDTDEGDKVIFRDPTPRKNKDEAKAVVRSKLKNLARGEGTATFEIEGNPKCKSEVPVLVSDVRSKVDGTWNPTTVTHSWGSDGYETTVECEPPEKNSKGGKANAKGKKGK